MNKFRVGLRVLAELGLYGIIGHLEDAIKLLASTLNNITHCDMVRFLPQFMNAIYCVCKL